MSWTHLLHNAIQENIDGWCMISITKSFIWDIFFASTCQFSLKILIQPHIFSSELKKVCSHYKSYSELIVWIF